MELTYRQLADLISELEKYAARLPETRHHEAAMLVTALGVAAAIGRDELRFEDDGEENRAFYASIATSYAPDAPGKVSGQLHQLARFLRDGRMSTELPRPLADFPDAGRFLAAHVRNVRSDTVHVYVVSHDQSIEVVDETGAQLAEAIWLPDPIPAWYLASDRLWRSPDALVAHLRRVDY